MTTYNTERVALICFFENIFHTTVTKNTFSWNSWRLTGTYLLWICIQNMKTLWVNSDMYQIYDFFQWITYLTQRKHEIKNSMVTEVALWTLNDLSSFSEPDFMYESGPSFCLFQISLIAWEYRVLLLYIWIW